MWPRTLVTLFVAAVALPLASGAAPRVTRSRLHRIQSAYAQYTKGDRYLAVGALGSGVTLWDGRTGERQAELVGTGINGFQFAINPDGTRLYAPGAKALLHVWDLHTRNEVEFAEPVRCAGEAIDPSGSTLAIAQFAGIELWDLRSGTRLHVLKGHDFSHVETLDFTSDGHLLVSGGEPPPDEDAAGEVIVWRVSDGKPLLRLANPATAVGFTAGNSWFAMLSDREATVREVRDGRVVWKRSGRDATVLSVASGSNACVIGTESGTAEMWDVRAGRRTVTLRGGDQPILATAISSDGKHVAAVDAEENVYQWHFDQE